jgi:hypothetical protein
LTAKLYIGTNKCVFEGTHTCDVDTSSTSKSNIVNVEQEMKDRVSDLASSQVHLSAKQIWVYAEMERRVNTLDVNLFLLISRSC